MTATDLNMRLTIARGFQPDTHPDDMAAAAAHDTSLIPGRRVWWRHPRTNRVLHGTIIGRRARSLEVFVHADGQARGTQWWTLPTYALNVDAPRDRVWWPERRTVTNDEGFEEIVVIGVDGHGTCTCGADSPVTEPDACQHIREVRASQDDPWRHGWNAMEDIALADEAWRADTERRAATLTKLMRAIHDAAARIRLHEEAKNRQPTNAGDAIDRFGDQP